MITKDNIRQLLLSPELGFKRSSDYIYEVLERYYEETGAKVYVDFANEKIEYHGIQADRNTSQNFSKPEFFVVLECVCRLLEIGYKPSQIVLEPKTPGGREDSNFYCDILIRDNDNVPYLLIECKNAGKDYDDEWKKMKRDGGQPFRYYNTYRQAKYLCLYSSDFIDGRLKREYQLIKMTDNEEQVQDASIDSYAKVSARNGSFEDYFHVWAETYGFDSVQRGAFEGSIPPFGISDRKLTAEDDLNDVDNEEIKKKYNDFAVILRRHNVGSHENAFDKLVNLFLAKVVDETNNPNDLHFYWKGKSYDDDFSLQDRLQRLYRDGMKKFLHEDVTYIEEGEINKAFRWVQNDLDATKRTIKEYFRQLKFYSDNDYSFISVHNKRLFEQNAEILREVVEMLQNIRLRTSEEHQNQLLGDLFEGFLNKGVKQNEGQFFTPMPIVRFIVSSLPLEQIIKESAEAPYAIDYACGAGHFLTEYNFRIKDFVKKYHEDIPLSEYYERTYGIEKEYRLSKVTKVSAFMYGHDDTTVIYGDALNHIDKVKDNMFSVLIANPPYAVSGFLETLPEKERLRYTLYNKDINLGKNNAIETFFMERSTQLMKAGGVAGIVLPISVLTKDGIYTHAREIILQNFDIIALAKFGSGTFGKTGTSTVVMFLRRKETNTPEAEHYRSRVESWFNVQHNADEIYQDVSLLDAYCKHMGYDIDDYIQFLNGSIPNRMKQSEVFQNYQESFFGNQQNAMKGGCNDAKVIRAKFRQKQKTETYKKLSDDDRVCLVNQAFYSFVRAIEKDKVYYFILAFKTTRPVVLMNMPSGKENESATKEGQKFLGYKWSDTKGDEGIKYLHVKKNKKKGDEEDGNAEDDDTMQQIRGIKGIVTPLFSPVNLNDEHKINTIIRKNFLNEDVNIPDGLEEIVSCRHLVDILDFSRTAFNKELPTNKTNITKYESKYELKRLSYLIAEEPQYGANEAATEGNPLTDYRYIRITDIQDDGTLGNDWKAAERVEEKYILREGDLLFARSGATAGKFFYYREIYGKALYAGYLIRYRFNADVVLPLYVYQFLFSHEYNDWAIKTRGGSGQPNINTQQFSSFEIPLPPISVQQQIADECAIIDRQQEEKKRRMAEVLEEMDNLRNSISGDSKRLKDIAPFVTERIAYTDISPESFITTDNMLQNCEGVKPYIGTPEIQSVIEYRKGDILLSNIRPYLRKLWLADCGGGCNPDVLVLRCNDDKIVDSTFLYYLLRNSDFFDYIMEDVKGLKMPRGKKEHIEKFELRLPNIEEQRELVKAFVDLDTELAAIKSELQDMPQRKQAILDKYLK